MKFNELAVGDSFLIRGKAAFKVNNTHYKLGFSDVLHRTTGTANVNGLSGDKAHAEKQKTQRQTLNQIAKEAGYKNWSALGKAALEGAMIFINYDGGKSR